MTIKKSLITGLAALAIVGPTISPKAQVQQNLSSSQANVQIEKNSMNKRLLGTEFSLNPFIEPDTTLDIGWDRYNHSEQAKQNRINLINQAYNLSDVDKLPADPIEFECTDFSMATQMEFSGFLRPEDEASSTHSEYDTLVTPNKFNIPCYLTNIFGSFGHKFNAFMVGNDIRNFDDWYFVEPQTDKPIKVGEWNFPSDFTGDMQIQQPIYSRDGQDVFSSTGLVTFLFTKGKVDSIRWIYPYEELVLTRPQIPVSVDEPLVNELPQGYFLSQNYPNPMNPSTTIEFKLPKKSDVEIEVYNVLGQKVKTLTDRIYSAGNHNVTWNGKNNSGEQVASGMYLYRAIIDDKYSTSKKIILEK